MKTQSKIKSKPILGTDKPIENEVDVVLEITDVRYGNSNIENPQITTLYNGKKITLPLPFTNPLRYQYEKVENQMVFKFAITSHDDLLGFIYLEIPQKFKYNTNFTIDDWFPVKQVETEEGKMTQTNFVARICFSYKASRQLLNRQLLNTNTGKIMRQDEMVKTLKEKLSRINQAVNFYEEEKFNHLS